MRNAIAVLVLVSTSACAAPANLHELSYASFQRPSSNATATVGDNSYAVLTFAAVSRGLGGCHESNPCNDPEVTSIMTEMFAVGDTPILVFTPENKVYAASIARSVRCADAPDAPVSADFAGIGVDDFAAWQFFGLCPGD